MQKFSLVALCSAAALVFVTPASAAVIVDFVGKGTTYSGGSGNGIVSGGGATNFLFHTGHFAMSPVFSNGGVTNPNTYSFKIAYEYAPLYEAEFFNIFLNGTQIGSFSIAPGVGSGNISGSGNFAGVDTSTGIQLLYRVAQNVTVGSGSVRFLDTGSSFTLDSVAGVPEPSTWALMIIGFGGIGAAMRRRAAAGRVTARVSYSG